MTVFPITFIVSACLLAMFILFFARENSRHQRKRGVDQEALLPLEEETPRVVETQKKAGKGAAGHDSSEPRGKPCD